MIKEGCGDGSRVRHWLGTGSSAISDEQSMKLNKDTL